MYRRSSNDNVRVHQGRSRHRLDDPIRDRSWNRVLQVGRSAPGWHRTSGRSPGAAVPDQQEDGLASPARVAPQRNLHNLAVGRLFQLHHRFVHRRIIKRPSLRLGGMGCTWHFLSTSAWSSANTGVSAILRRLTAVSGNVAVILSLPPRASMKLLSLFTETPLCPSSLDTAV